MFLGYATSLVVLNNSRLADIWKPSGRFLEDFWTFADNDFPPFSAAFPTTLPLSENGKRDCPGDGITLLERSATNCVSLRDSREHRHYRSDPAKGSTSYEQRAEDPAP